MIPSLDCVDSWNGKLTAYFGYENDNGVSISVPYGTAKNYFPLDVQNERPALFEPGEHRFDFGIGVKPGQTLAWKLSPPNSPTTEVRATASSPRCTDGMGRRCARYCEATLASECIDEFDVNWNECITACIDGYQNQFAGTNCEDEWATFLGCVAATPPPEENWSCEPFLDWLPHAVECESLITDALDCLYAPP